MPRTLKELQAAQWAIIEELEAHIEQTEKEGLEIAPVYLRNAKVHALTAYGKMQTAEGPFTHDDHIRAQNAQAANLEAVQRQAGAFASEAK